MDNYMPGDEVVGEHSFKIETTQAGPISKERIKMLRGLAEFGYRFSPKAVLPLLAEIERLQESRSDAIKTAVELQAALDSIR